MLARMTSLSILAAAVLAVAGTGPAVAEYPDKPITMVVGYAAGGGTDISARSLAPYIERYLGGGARILVENRPGAGGEIGFAAVSDAAPDGYTIGFVNTPNFLTIPIERKTRYKVEQFDLLANIVDDPGAFSVHADGPIKTLADLVAYAKANPNTVSVGTTGVGSDDHIAMLIFQKQTGTKLVHVPFPGAAAGRTALLGKHIMVGCMNIGEAMQYSQGQPLRTIGVMADKRWSLAPDVPTFAEQGLPITLSSLRGIAAPVGLPPAIRAKLVKAILDAARDPAFQAAAAQTFQPLRILDSAEYTAVLKQMDGDFRELWKTTPWSR
ncbi:MAG: tripartite tricarboxylate transporter substrate binding protein [Rhodoplanes sp.]|uniref:tripartite tricarboxylate transporter substrate binding protein n=1 Tax=Rhodoplanes sp. TaxID=1968906 RepID=UPI0017DE409A|nr:tripartite tricarboxylate transporter substrate binding protein [Rhodoplanes sp.]NVO14367.1 tripartite tricarboxylate transporter substrate binding protein [Rhodoplanes sp.]